MIKEIIKDTMVLSQKSEKATKAEVSEIVRDLIDTANEHLDRCVGLAAIQIGYNKRICIIRDGEDKEGKTKWLPIINPMIIAKSATTYTAIEGCMSFDGEREVKRYNNITIMSEDRAGKMKKQILSGIRAQVAQHEIDHMSGILI